jgi:hypothetical protein
VVTVIGSADIARTLMLVLVKFIAVNLLSFGRFNTGWNAALDKIDEPPSASGYPATPRHVLFKDRPPTPRAILDFVKLSV